MKRLLVIRHAKSSWANPGQDDFDRPLNERGERDAPEMAKRLRDQKIEIDAFVSSTAKRALSTATFFAKEYDVAKKDIQTHRELYHAAPQTFFDVVGKLDDGVKTAAVFSHNPGITSFVNQLSDVQIDSMPTCAVFAVKTDIKHWKDFEKAEKEFWFFDYPKSH